MELFLLALICNYNWQIYNNHAAKDWKNGAANATKN